MNIDPSEYLRDTRFLFANAKLKGNAGISFPVEAELDASVLKGVAR
ncbi:MAG: hypothetical protein AAFN77_14795 [Planctomycetota bacterium]